MNKYKLFFDMLFLLKKNIDRSLLREGFSIPIEAQTLIHEAIGYTPVGQSRAVDIWIDGEVYQAVLKNQDFDRRKYLNHCDVLQVRYSPRSPIALKLQSVFVSSFNYFEEQLKLTGKTKKQITLPDSINEYISFELNDSNELCINCFTAKENIECLDLLQQEDELRYEISDMDISRLHDNNTGYAMSLQKVRRLNNSIGESLKRLYDYRCQITGERIGEKYGQCVIEAHHIEYFTKSLNNDASNIIIVNPSFHRIIHKNKPGFDREHLCFRFPNGVVEKVKLDKHLKVKY